MDPIKSNRAKTGVFNTEVSFQIVQFEFDLKRNSSGRTWIHEYTTPPLHFKGWTGFCGTLSLLSKCYTCFQMNEQCIHRPNSELESKWVVGIQKMVKVWTLFQNCFQSKILLRYLGKTKALIGGGGRVFIYRCSARRISLEIWLTSKEIRRTEHQCMNRHPLPKNL